LMTYSLVPVDQKSIKPDWQTVIRSTPGRGPQPDKTTFLRIVGRPVQ